MLWYTKTIEEIYRELETSSRGLTSTEATRRIKSYGPNSLDLKKEPWWRVVIEPFRSVFVGVLALAALISIISHEPLDAVIIIAIMVINATIFYVQQYTTNRVLRSLKRHSIQQVRVIRYGEEQKISSTNLVPGDLIKLTEGERVPADARLIEVENLQIDESSLTGESVPVHKKISVLSPNKQVYEQDNTIFQGTYVLAGTATAIVVETGHRTEFGKVADLASTKIQKSPVQTKIDNLITVLVKVIGVIAALVFILSLARDTPPVEALRFVMSLAVSAVPEGLPVALTVIIVLGMRRMARYKALVHSFKAIEDIGLITTIATDKTGTLTKNHLEVIDTWAIDSDREVKSDIAKTLDEDGELSDPLDIALRDCVDKDSAKPDKFYPFSISLRMSGAYYQSDKTLYIKGAPEHILYNCKIKADSHKLAEKKLHELAAKGFRVIALAYYTSSKAPTDLSKIGKGDLEFIGLVAFADELRPEAKPAIAAAQAAGINVKLITGDHFETAFNIGKELGLATHRDKIIQGTELPKEDAALAKVVNQKTVFARILPEDKFRILQALKKTDITAMTGDGVNDVPALTNAHVGIAMGSGSDIAKDAGGIVLLDDNFATIIYALSEGRKIFDNIRRMLFYLLSTTLGEVMTMIGALVVGLPLPVTAIQILWINLVTETVMVLPLGLEPEEKDHMKRPPRDSKDPLLSHSFISRMILISVTMALVTLVTVSLLKDLGYETGYIQTVAFTTLIAAQWMNAFNARSEYESLFSRIKRMNYALLVGLAIAFTLQLFALFGPLQIILNVEPVSLTLLLIPSVIMMVAILVVSELHKAFGRHTARS
jgi:Ca2+-transporting ATPase